MIFWLQHENLLVSVEVHHPKPFVFMNVMNVVSIHGLFIHGWIIEMLQYVKWKNMQTKKTVCTWKGKYDTANNQTTNTFRILQKSIVSIQAAQAVIKHSDVSTTTMETTATQGLVLRYGMRFWPAPKYSMCSVSRT